VVKILLAKKKVEYAFWTIIVPFLVLNCAKAELEWYIVHVEFQYNCSFLSDICYLQRLQCDRSCR